MTERLVEWFEARANCCLRTVGKEYSIGVLVDGSVEVAHSWLALQVA